VYQTSRLALSDGEPFPPAASPSFFSAHSHEKRGWIRKTVKKIGQAVGELDVDPAIVYVAKERDTHFTKVGFSEFADATRFKVITKSCGVAFEKTYRTLPFRCAHRAEQIVHKVLHQWAHDRRQCKCGRINCEWYKRTFGFTIALVNLVHTWMAQEPYDMRTRRLKDEWKEALFLWDNSQDTTKPLSWPEFFLIGLKLHLLPKSSPTSSPLGRRQKSASMTNISSTTAPSSRFRRRLTNRNSPLRPPIRSHANSLLARL
jgi:hypothetical protein